MFRTFAVVLILMVTGFRPHENRIIPPARTAATTAAEVQLAAVPLPTTRLGWDVSNARPAAGTGTERTPGADRRASERADGTNQSQTIKQQSHAIGIDARRGIKAA